MASTTTWFTHGLDTVNPELRGTKAAVDKGTGSRPKILHRKDTAGVKALMPLADF